jgi:hypothetical protein
MNDLELFAAMMLFNIRENDTANGSTPIEPLSKLSKSCVF